MTSTKEVHDIDNQQRKYQELIRCKDCEHYSERWKVCEEFDYRQLPEDFYCAAAKRRDTEHKELVRCKDCKHVNLKDFVRGTCKYRLDMLTPYGYCERGER